MLKENKAPEIQGTTEAISEASVLIQCKDSENQAHKQETARDFAHRYLVGTAAVSFQYRNEHHAKVETDFEAYLCEIFECYITGNQGDKVPYFFLADGRNAVRVYNGRYFERIEQEEFGLIIKRVLYEAGTSRVYTQKSHKPIADEVLKELYYNPQRRWQPNSQYLVFTNGVLDTSTMQLMPFSEQYQTNNIFDFDYTENAECPRFRKALSEALDDDTAKVLQELFGYQLFSDARHERIGILVGAGRNGKSVILKAVAYALGRERVTNYSLPQITDKSGIHISAMVGKMANICFDSGSVVKVGDEAIFKQYVSGEPILCKRLYQQPYLTTDYPQSIIAVNALPQSSDMSDGWFRRMLIIDFPHQVPLEKVDTQLFDKLRTERVGILLWVLEGMKRLIEQGHFSTSEAIEEVANQYRKDTDSVADWLEELGYFPTDKESLTLTEVFERYDKWRDANRFQPMKRTTFRKRLEALKYKVWKSGTTVVGIGQNIDENTPF